MVKGDEKDIDDDGVVVKGVCFNGDLDRSKFDLFCFSWLCVVEGFLINGVYSGSLLKSVETLKLFFCALDILPAGIVLLGIFSFPELSILSACEVVSKTLLGLVV